MRRSYRSPPRRTSKRVCTGLLDRDSVLQAVRTNGLWLANKRQTAPHLVDDDEIVLTAVRQNGLALQFASERIRTTGREIVREACMNKPEALERFAGEQFQQDRDLILSIAQKNGNILKHVAERFRDDKEIVMVALGNFGYFFQFVSERLRGHGEVVLQAVNNGPESCLQYASSELKGDRNIVLAAVARYGSALAFASPELRGDVDLAQAALRSKWGRADEVMQVVSADLRSNRQFVLAAIQKSGRSIFFASQELQEDRELVVAALANDDSLLVAQKYLEDDNRGTMADDHEIMMAAVTGNGLALQYASDELTKDHELVMTAIATGCGSYGDYMAEEDDYCILRFASYELRNDPQVVSEALENCLDDLSDTVWSYCGRTLKTRLSSLAAAVAGKNWLNQHELEEMIELWRTESYEKQWLLSQICWQNATKQLPTDAQKVIFQFSILEDFRQVASLLQCAPVIKARAQVLGITCSRVVEEFLEEEDTGDEDADDDEDDSSTREVDAGQSDSSSDGSI